jgi:predicted alpha/beta superfamily hydrolase
VGHTVVGTLKVLTGFWSPQLQNRRDILVYLPPSYDLGEQRYPVIYMHDGQNLFDDATSYVGEWCVDETMEALSESGVEAIVVGIPNQGEQRLDEYSPFRDRLGHGGRGDAYLNFIVRTLKPRIDHDFHTLPGRGHTSIAGSSMGGLISLYAALRYGGTFGAAGVMSPSLWFANRAIFGYTRKALFVPGRLYLDLGLAEGKEMVADARRMRTLLCEKGYRLGGDLMYVEDRNGRHSESAWSGRLPTALQFLLPQRHGAPRAQLLASDA